MWYGCHWCLEGISSCSSCNDGCRTFFGAIWTGMLLGKVEEREVGENHWWSERRPQRCGAPRRTDGVPRGPTRCKRWTVRSRRRVAISQRFVAAMALHVSFKIAEEGGGVDDGMRTLRVKMTEVWVREMEIGCGRELQDTLRCWLVMFWMRRRGGY